MAVIKHQELFDFEGYQKAIKDAEQANVGFGKTVTGINDRINAQYTEIRSELQEYLGVLKSFNVNQKSAGGTIIRTGEAATSASKKIAEQKRVMMELAEVVDLSARGLNELKSAGKGLEAEYASLAGRSDDVRAKKAALAAEYKRVTAAAKEQAQVLKTTKTVLDAAEGSYAALQLELSVIGKELKGMTGAFDPLTGKINQNNKAAVELAKRYLDVNNVLKTADAQLGNFQRNVGNYASATHSLSQVLRELPSLGISTQQFFLAISNNLPILFDQFNTLSKSIDANTGKMLGSQKALKIFASSIFGVTNLLTIGVALLSVYGKQVVDFIGDLFTSKKALNETEEAQRLLNAAMSDANGEYSQAIASVSELEQNIQLAKDGILKKTDVVKFYNETIGKTTGEVNSLEQAEQALIKNKDAYLQMMLQKAVATAAFAEAAKKTVESQVNANKEAEKFASTTDKINAAGLTALSFLPGVQINKVAQVQGKVIHEQGVKRREATIEENKKDADLFTKIGEDAQKKGAELAKAFNFNFFDVDKGKKGKDQLKEQEDLLKKLLDESIAAMELQLSQELITEEEFQIKKLQLIQKYADAAIEIESKRKGGADKGTVSDINKARIDAEVEYNKFVKKFSADNLKEDLDNAKEEIKSTAEFKAEALRDEYETVLSTKRLTDKQKEALEVDYQNRIDALIIESLERRILLETDATKRAAMEKEKIELERGIIARGRKFDEKAIQDKYNVEINAAKTAFDLIRAGRNTSFTEELAYLEKLKAIKIKYAKDTAEEELAIARLKAEREKTLREEIQKTIFEALNAGLQITQNIMQGSFEAELAKLQETKDQELALAGNNAAARAKIEEQYNKRVAEVKNRQAKSDRIFALFQVAINTAMGISKTIAEFGMPAAIPFIALALISGALQAAVIASRPLPKYKKGRKGGPAEWAVVDEAGPELIIDKHGRLKEIGGKGARMTHLESGSKVITASDTKRMLRDMETQNIMREMGVTSQLSSAIRAGKQNEMIYVMAKAMERGGIDQRALESSFRKAVQDIPIQQLISDERGQRMREKTVNSTITYLNNLSRI